MDPGCLGNTPPLTGKGSKLARRRREKLSKLGRDERRRGESRRGKVPAEAQRHPGEMRT